MTFIGAFAGFQTAKSKRACKGLLSSFDQCRTKDEKFTYRSVGHNVRKIDVGEQNKEVQ